MKNKIENALYISQFVAFMVATILALSFEFSGLEALLICALVLYVVAFGLMTINGCIDLNGKYKALKNVLAAPNTMANTTPNAAADSAKTDNSETAVTNMPASATDIKNSDDDQNDESALKKQIVVGLVKVSLCAIFCLFSFVCLVLF